MFKLLKDKLSSWKEKIKKEFSDVEETAKPKVKEKKSNKKEKVSKKDTKSTKKVKQEKQTKDKKIKKDKKIEEKIEVQQIEQETETKKSEEKKEKGFFSKLFSKDEKEDSEKITELPQEEEIEEKKVSFFDKFKKKITQEKFEELFTELEMIMLQNNVAYDAVQSIKEKLGKELIGQNLSDSKINDSLKLAISEILINPPNFIKEIKEKLKEKKPYVITFVGINGSGKTTTIAKVAQLLKKEKLTVCLAAADTFRAAAIEQLEIHANNLKVPIIKKEYNTDPASVGFEAISYAKKNNIDVVLIDTAGRLNTKDSLMKEMEKIIRVTTPDLKIFLGESITGNDATEQARSFNESISLDGIILSKADIDEKGGTSLSVSFVTKKPIYFLGTGQSYDDLEVFEKEKIIEKLGL